MIRLKNKFLDLDSLAFAILKLVHAEYYSFYRKFVLLTGFRRQNNLKILHKSSSKMFIL